MTTPLQLIECGIEREFQWAATRSSGPGGQHVNKVSTRVEVRWSVLLSGVLSDAEKALLWRKLAGKITQSGEIVLAVQESRSQLANKEEAVTRLVQLIASALVVPKTRRATRPTRASVTRRLEGKRLQKQRKQNRKKDW